MNTFGGGGDSVAAVAVYSSNDPSDSTLPSRFLFLTGELELRYKKIESTKNTFLSAIHLSPFDPSQFYQVFGILPLQPISLMNKKNESILAL